MGFGLIETVLESRKRREGEIDKICSRHYADFLNSVQELMLIRGSADKISSDINDAHKSFDLSTRQVSLILRNLDSLQHESSNITNVSDDIQRCKDLTNLMVQTKKFIAEEDYFSALSTIEQLKKDIGVAGWKPFAATLVKWLPSLIDQLLSAAKHSIQTWLIEMQTKSSLAGITMMCRYTHNCILESILDESDTKKATCLSLLNMGKLENTDYALKNIWTANEYSQEVQNSIPFDLYDNPSLTGSQFLEDISETLAPLHKALHMHMQLGMLPRIKDLYCEGREVVITQKLITSEVEKSLLQYGLTGSALADIVINICGFFTLECIIQRSVDYFEGVFSWTQLRDIWNNSCCIVEGIIAKYKSTLNTPDQVLKIKEILLVAHETVIDEAVGMKDRSILDGTNLLWDKFVELQVKCTKDSCKTILNQELYQPLYVTTFSHYKNLVLKFQLDSAHFNLDSISETPNRNHTNNFNHQKFDAHANLDAMELQHDVALRRDIKQSYNSIDTTLELQSFDDHDSDEANFVPITLAFSGAVPKQMNQLNLSLLRFLQYITRNPVLSPRGSELCDAIGLFFKDIVDVLDFELSKDGSETPLSKACQISIDAAAFSYCCINYRDYIGEVLTHVSWFDAIDSSLDNIIDKSKVLLDSLSIRAQDLMFELLTSKVSDLLSSLCFINWCPSVEPNGPHESVVEIVDYLKVTFMWLTNLPRPVRDAAHFACCSKTMQGLLEFILSSKVASINLLSIMALDLDVKLLDQFADSCGVTQLKDCFSELRDIVRAMLHKDFLHFGDNPPILRRTFFPNLDVLKFAQLVEKVLFTICFTAFTYISYF
jgi:hypothetical protein